MQLVSFLHILSLFHGISQISRDISSNHHITIWIAQCRTKSFYTNRKWQAQFKLQPALSFQITIVQINTPDAGTTTTRCLLLRHVHITRQPTYAYPIPLLELLMSRVTSAPRPLPRCSRGRKPSVTLQQQQQQQHHHRRGMHYEYSKCGLRKG